MPGTHKKKKKIVPGGNREWWAAPPTVATTLRINIHFKTSHSQRARASELNPFPASCLYESRGQQARPRLALALFVILSIQLYFIVSPEQSSVDTMVLSSSRRVRVRRPLPPPQRFSCERSTGCSCSRIIFKFGMKVRYGKAKTPIVFGVGGVIVAMVTTFFVEIF